MWAAHERAFRQNHNNLRIQGKKVVGKSAISLWCLHLGTPLEPAHHMMLTFDRREHGDHTSIRYLKNGFKARGRVSCVCFGRTAKHHMARLARTMPLSRLWRAHC